MEPSNADLPFVLLYGPWIWKLAVGALVACVLALWVVRRRYLAKKDANEALRRLDHGREADGVIRGKLGGTGDVLAATLNVSRTYEGDERAHWRADDLWIETAEGRVKLVGDVTVELGTGGIAKRRRLPAMPDALAKSASELPRIEQKKWSSTKLVTLKAGDDVVVRGRIDRSTGGEETGFRDASVEWTVKPKDDEPIRLAARAPKPILLAMSIWAVVALAGGTGLVGYKLADAIGDRWRMECWNRDRYEDAKGFVELQNNDRCIRVAALPGQQERAYDSLLGALENHAYRDDRSLARMIALAEKTEGCPRVIRLLEEHARYDDIVVWSRKCGDKEHETEALVALGRYEEAAKVDLPPSRDGWEEPTIYTLIAAKRWREAAQIANERVKRYAAAARDPGDNSVDLAARHYTCLAMLFQHYAGDLTAHQRLRELAFDESSGSTCLPMLVEAASSSAERMALIKTHERDIYGTSDAARLLDTQASLEGERYPYEYESAERTLIRLDDPLGVNAVRLAWIARLTTISPTASLAERATALRWVAISQVLEGKVDAALATAAEVTRLLEGSEDNDDDLELRFPLGSDTALLEASVALYSSKIVDIDLDTAGLNETSTYLRESRYFRFGRLHLRAGRPIDTAYFGPDEKYVEALLAAQKGDAQLLADYASKDRWWTDGDILAVLPHVKTNRDALLRQLPWSRSYDQSYRNRRPFELAASAAVRRELFRAIGDAKQTAHWHAIYKRVESVMDRQRLMAFLLWDD